MIRLYASDLDGTLLKDATHFHSDALALLRERVAQGAIFVAVSGRSVASCRVLFESAGFALRYCIGVNGAHVAWGETGETLWMRSMPEEAARGAVEIIHSMGLRACVYASHAIAYSWPGALARSHEHELFERMRCYGVETSEDEAGLERALRGPVLKVLAVRRADGSDEQAFLSAQAMCAEMAGVAVTSSWFNNFEVMSAEADKGSALLALARQLGIAPEEIVAFGDGDNDAPMLRAVGTGVAMAHGTQRAKEAACCLAESVGAWLAAQKDTQMG